MKKYLFLALFLICGCSPVEVGQAKLEVENFRDLYHTKKYNGIYKSASPAFQMAISEKHFIRIMKEAIENHLGDYKKSTLKTEKFTHSLFANDEISLIYLSEYSRRIVQEIFIFEVEDKKVKLKSYRYDSIN